MTSKVPPAPAMPPAPTNAAPVSVLDALELAVKPVIFRFAVLVVP